jgi:hypothetical protein
MRKRVSFFIFFLIAISAAAQMKRLLKDRIAESWLNKDWYGAEQYLGRLYQRDSSDKVTWQYAEAARLNNNMLLAHSLYARLSARDEGKRYPLAFYWLGHVLKAREKYGEAKKSFGRFLQLDLPDEKYEYYNRKSKLELEACDHAPLMRKKRVVRKIESLGSSFNTRSSEFSAVEVDSTLYFSAVRVPERRDAAQMNADVYGKIFRSDRRRGKWTRPKPLDTLVNSLKAHNANPSFSADRSMLVFSRCKTRNWAEYDCQLCMSVTEGSRQHAGKILPAPVNIDGYNSTQPHLALVDSLPVLFFVSDRPGGKGGYDIWYSRMSNGVFSEPENAGAKINTADDELTPWYRNRDSTLYFSSTYLKGLGGYDIFRSRFEKGGFAEPVNAGYPVNSSYNDVYFSVNSAETKVYLSSNRPGSVSENKSNCCNDLYMFSIDTVPPKVPPPPIDTVKVREQEMRQLVPLTLYFHNDEPDPRTKQTTTTKSFDALHRSYMKMQVAYIEQFATGLEGEAQDQATSDMEAFFADSVEAGFQDLERFTHLLEEVLLKGETVKITMRGYCSPLASTDYNINLAKRRISSLRNYFMQVRHGVFEKYVNAPEGSGGRIIFEEVEVGELPVSKVSDNLKDKRSSVYSPDAASERKIQIIAVSFGS